MQPYLPGMPLFQFFWNKLIGHFSDFHLFIGNSLLAVSMMLGMTKYINWRQYYLVIPMTFLLISFPLISYNSGFDRANFYSSLFIDPMLAIVFIYTLVQLFEDPFSDKFRLLKFSLSLFFLILLKDSGLMFAIIIVALAFILKWSVYNKEKQSNTKRFFIYAVPIASVLLPYFSWKMILKIFRVSTTSSNQLYISALSQSESCKTAIHSFLQALIEKPIVISSNILISRGISFLCMFALFLLLSIVLIAQLKKEERKKTIIIFVMLILANICFVAGLLIVYIGSLGPSLPSYPRYINTIVLADCLFLFYLFVYCLMKREAIRPERNRIMKGIALSALTIFLIIAPLQKQSMPLAYSRALADGDKISDIILHSVESNHDSAKINVFYVAGSDEYGPSQTHHKAYYNLLGHNIIIRNFWSETSIIDREVQTA